MRGERGRGWMWWFRLCGLLYEGFVMEVIGGELSGVEAG